MVKNWQKFMLESNKIEGEDRLNPGDDCALEVACYSIASTFDIRDIHKILTRHLKVNWSGEWRTCQVYVGNHIPCSPEHVANAMEDYMSKWDDMDSWTAHNEFQKIHPFQDFNGRTGRLLWLNKAIDEGYNYNIPFLQMYYYQTLSQYEG